MKKTFVLLAAMLALPAMANDASAQSIDMTSSMTANCINTAPASPNCSMVRFYLQLDGSSTVDVVRIFSNGSPWTFGSLVSVRDGTGADVTSNWFSGVSSSQLQLSAFASPAAPEPLLLTVNMSSWGTAGQLTNGSLTYNGQGFNAGAETFGGMMLSQASAEADARLFYSRHGCDSPVAARFFNNVADFAAQR